jgi:hypothetical protein
MMTIKRCEARIAGKAEIIRAIAKKLVSRYEDAWLELKIQYTLSNAIVLWYATITTVTTNVQLFHS